MRKGVVLSLVCLQLQASLSRNDASPGSSPSGGQASPAGSGLPRSQPISVTGKEADDQANQAANETAKAAALGDINSLSPPSVSCALNRLRGTGRNQFDACQVRLANLTIVLIEHLGAFP